MSADAEATLELTFLLSSPDGLRLKPPTDAAATNFPAASLFRKPKPFVVAWVDPAFKKSTSRWNPKCDDPKLHFPLTSKTLLDPRSTLTIQILTYRRLPFLRSHAGGAASDAKLEGSATVPLSCIPAAAADRTVLTLPLRRPSGRETGGWVRINARLLWCLGPVPANEAAAESVEWVAEAADVIECYWPEPSAPPLPEANCQVPAVALHPLPAENREESKLARVDGNELLKTERSCLEVAARDHDGMMGLLCRVDENDSLITGRNCQVVAAGTPAPIGGTELCKVEKSVPIWPQGAGRQRAFRCFLHGLVSGAVASIMIVAAAVSDF